MVARRDCPTGANRKEIIVSFILKWLITAIATIAAINLVPGIVAVGGPWIGPIACSLMLALIDVSIKPILQVLSIPITVITLGIFYLIVNALLLELASWLSTSVLGVGIYIESFGAAFLGAIIISIVSAILSSVMGA